MKQLIQAVNRHKIFASLRPLNYSLLNNYAPQKAHFSIYSNYTPPGSDGKMSETEAKLIEKEKKLFEALSDKERLYYQAHRLALLKSIEEAAKDKKHWWNKIESLNEDQVEQLPDDHVHKFGSWLQKIDEIQGQARIESNQMIGSQYDQIKNLSKLLTNEEKARREALKARQKEDAIKLQDFQYSKDNYMTRQPRLDLSKHQYNYEQFRQYTSLYEEAKKKDDQESRYFYKMVKYSLAHKDKGLKSAVDFAKKYRLDLITIPEEFKDENIEDFELRKSRKNRRPIIKTRTNRDIRNYDAWRAHDRDLMKTGGKQKCIRKIMLPPALLVRAFGMPDSTKIGFEGTGDYEFEDNNLDVFSINDYKQTDFYWGLNREDEYYDKYLHKRPHKRRHKWPTIKEFWETMEPKEFKLHCQDYADWRKFIVWLRRTLKEVDKQTIQSEEDVAARFGHEFDICLGNYEEKGKVNHDNIGVFKYDFTYFMTPDEIKKLPQEKLPEPLIPQRAPADILKANRVFMTKEELSKIQEEEQEKAKAM